MPGSQGWELPQLPFPGLPTSEARDRPVQDLGLTSTVSPGSSPPLAFVTHWDPELRGVGGVEERCQELPPQGGQDGRVLSTQTSPNHYSFLFVEPLASLDPLPPLISGLLSLSSSYFGISGFLSPARL